MDREKETLEIEFEFVDLVSFYLLNVGGREYVDWGRSGPGCIYGNVWCGSNFQGIFVIIREKKI